MRRAAFVVIDPVSTPARPRRPTPNTCRILQAEMPLSKLTCASLEDIGYVVQPAEVNDQHGRVR